MMLPRHYAVTGAISLEHLAGTLYFRSYLAEEGYLHRRFNLK